MRERMAEAMGFRMFWFHERYRKYGILYGGIFFAATNPIAMSHGPEEDECKSAVCKNAVRY